MPDTTGAAVVELAYERDQRNIGEMDDVTLVWAMYGLHSAWEHGPMMGGGTERGATLTRQVFTEVARRWIPPTVFGEALTQLGYGEEVSDDA